MERDAFLLSCILLCNVLKSPWKKSCLGFNFEAALNQILSVFRHTGKEK